MLCAPRPKGTTISPFMHEKCQIGTYISSEIGSSHRPSPKPPNHPPVPHLAVFSLSFGPPPQISGLKRSRRADLLLIPLHRLMHPTWPMVIPHVLHLNGPDLSFQRCMHAGSGWMTPPMPLNQGKREVLYIHFCFVLPSFQYLISVISSVGSVFLFLVWLLITSSPTSAHEAPLPSKQA